MFSGRLTAEEVMTLTVPQAIDHLAIFEDAVTVRKLKDAFHQFKAKWAAVMEILLELQRNCGREAAFEAEIPTVDDSTLLMVLLSLRLRIQVR
jgi:hypothetical protein